MARLALHCFGPFRATLDGEPLSGFVSDKVRALLIYLAVEANRPHRRETLAGLLWPGFAERSARTSLRRALANLRQLLDDKQANPPFLFSSRNEIQFNQESDHSLDVRLFYSLIKGYKGLPRGASGLEEALGLYQSDFLEAFSLPDSPAFEEWILVTRESFRRQLIKALQNLAKFHEEQKHYVKTLQYARRQVALDPYQEAAHRQVMRLLALCGERNEALVHYQQLCRLLKEDLGVSPSLQTKELYESLQNEGFNVEEPERPATTLSHNLPAQVTSFIGRRSEISEVEQLLSISRLLTLTGPPGTGKTRLALEVASRAIQRFPDGVFVVDLASISDPQFIPSRIAQMVGVRESAGCSLVESLKNHFQQRYLLLLLDNFEQLIEGASLISDLLAAAPGLKVLITSREPLHLYGEQEYPVPPLIVPDLGNLDPLPILSQLEAIELFILRAQAVKPDFLITEDNASAVAEICVRLDGLPLAIELAAARSKLLSPEMIRERLGNRLGALAGGSRDLPARLRGLRAAIDWSYELLDNHEKTLFARLAVFQGGRTVDAVETVCSHDLSLDAIDGLESLLNKSLIQQEPGPDGNPRFTMLETIHEYARERLEKHGEAGKLQKNHAEYFVSLVEQSENNIFGVKADECCARLRAEFDNIRTAIIWSLENEEVLLALRLAAALREFWYGEGHTEEGLTWIEQALGSGIFAPPALQAKALNSAGMLASSRGEYKRGEQFHLDALNLSREFGDRTNEAWALVFLGGDKVGSPDQYEEGIAFCKEALALFQELDDKPGAIQALTMIGELARLAGNYDLAKDAYEECLVVSRAAEHRLREGLTYGNLATVAQHQGEFQRAIALYLQDLLILQELGLKYHMATGIALWAGPMAAMGEPEVAARLIGASEAMLKNMRIGLHPSDQVELDQCIDDIREQLNEETFNKAWTEGQDMTLEEAVNFVESEFINLRL